MEDLPPPLLLDILSRLPDSTALARCRLASRTLRSLSYHVPSVALLCSHDRFMRSRAPATRDRTLPFKTLAVNLLSLLAAGGGLRSLTLGIERPFVANNAWDDDDHDDSDDLHLTAAEFVSQWLPLVGRRLSSLSISDYWIQSCWRRSEALAFISDHCGSLLDLVVRNAWLSVEGLKPMMKLTSLTLEFIRLDDEDLDKLNECFPSLQVLNLIGVGGLKGPKIHLPQLRVCHWTISNFPLSLTILAPMLIELKLKCVEPMTLVLDTPQLSRIDLQMKRPGGVVKVGRFHDLKSVRLESSYLQSLAQVFASSKTIKMVELDSPGSTNSGEAVESFSIMDLVSAFPCMDDLKVGHSAWVGLEKSFCCRGTGVECEWRNLKNLVVYLPLLEFDITFLSFVLNLCAPFCKVTLFFHGDVPTATRMHIISRCTSNFQKVRWRWGVWKESHEYKFLDL